MHVALKVGALGLAATGNAERLPVPCARPLSLFLSLALCGLCARCLCVPVWPLCPPPSLSLSIWPVCLSVCLSTLVCVSLPVRLRLSVCPSASVCLSVCLSVCASVCLSVCLPLSLPVCLCLSVFLPAGQREGGTERERENRHWMESGEWRWWTRRENEWRELPSLLFAFG
jgi:hypothetical protein